jgi:hypothetical protein
MTSVEPGKIANAVGTAEAQMRTMSPRVENRRIDGTTRLAIRSPWDAVVWAVSTALRRFMPERWIIDLLVLALALFLVGASALYGLAVASKSVPPPDSPMAGRLLRADQESGTGVINACTDLLSGQDKQ